MPCNIEYLLPVIRRKCLFCLRYCKISWFVNNSVCRCHKHKCPHNGICDLCIFAIFSNRGFVDIVPLCCKRLLCCVQPVRLGCRLWRQPGLRQHREPVRDKASNVHSVVTCWQCAGGGESNVSWEHVSREIWSDWVAQGNFSHCNNNGDLMIKRAVIIHRKYYLPPLQTGRQRHEDCGNIMKVKPDL